MGQVWRYVVLTLLSLSLQAPFALAQGNFKQVLQKTPTSRLLFSPHTIGVVIADAVSRVYILNARKGQWLRVEPQGMGARALVVVFDKQGKQLASLSNGSSPFEYQLPASGDYYILASSGPTNHRYNFVLSVFTEGG
ncbi:hypothetical protein GlitD10_1169 [Gloeomargarita lithophora Alchichica-D10]|uniref:Uncharacterized protein n=1 Tax=Gloeomargarita lithophora Alchichica-D10 TaxID=1188229 RepID=A0A1J0AC58_9CYAN|nr:hypothetical protein [Gloeomargarita lithophora]APB33489.1 hypothetical protein GlitD10_1169 [Gloeomargarita lithophora Alchichica-D10]